MPRKKRFSRKFLAKGKQRGIYTLRKCAVKDCPIPVFLGPLDPDVKYCPVHAYKLLKKKVR